MSKSVALTRKDPISSEIESYEDILKTCEKASLHGVEDGEIFYSDDEMTDSDSEPTASTPEPTEVECFFCNLFRQQLYEVGQSGPFDGASYVEVQVGLEVHLREHNLPIPIEKQLLAFGITKPLTFSGSDSSEAAAPKDGHEALHVHGTTLNEAEFDSVFAYSKYEDEFEP